MQPHPILQARWSVKLVPAVTPVAALTQASEHITLCILEGLSLLCGHTFGQLILKPIPSRTDAADAACG
jgi:hypothetical protein